MNKEQHMMRAAFRNVLVVCDIDNVITDSRGRDHLVPSDMSHNDHWRDHQAQVHIDPLIHKNIALVKTLCRAARVSPIFLSSRLEFTRAMTTQALKNAGFDDFTLILRPMDFHGKPWDLKHKWMLDIRKRNKDDLFDIIFIEDCPRNINQVMQCPEVGKFITPIQLYPPQRPETTYGPK